MTDKKDKRYDYIIYKLCCDECDDFYVGSTRNIVQRKKTHKTSCNNPKNKAYNTKIYRTMREFGGWDEWRLCPHELMENSTKFEAECQEEVVRMRLKAELNSRRASCGGITREDYQKQYYQEHKEYIKEYSKGYRDGHYEEKKDYIKHYYEGNRATILEQKKNFYQENKDKITEKFDCPCGSQYMRSKKNRHFRSQKHQKYVDSLKIET